MWKMKDGMLVAPYMQVSTSGLTAVHLVSAFGRRSFGLGYAALHLAAAVNRAGAKVYVASLDDRADGLQACEAVGIPGERFVCGSPIGNRWYRFAPFSASRLAKMVHGTDTVIHLHGMWSHISWVAARVKRRWGCPLVLSPHGSLQPYALSLSALKKAIAVNLYERENVFGASCLWALSPQEEASIRIWGYQGRIAVIPNGVNRGPRCAESEVAEFRAHYAIPAASRILLCMSRLAPIKNIPLLLRSFAHHLPSAPNWTLVIAGGDEGGHLQEIISLVEGLGIRPRVRIIGKVVDREKARALSSASVFVLPSRSEGLPIAVLEAMEYGKPVLVTDGWSLPVVNGARYGWRARVEEESFRSMLLEAMTTSDAVLEEMGREAQEMVHAHYDWDSIGRQACTLYSDLISNHYRAATEGEGGRRHP